MNIKKGLNYLIVIVTVCGCLMANAPFSYASEALSDAQKKQQELNDSLTKAKNLVKGLEQSKNTTEEKIAAIDKEIDSLDVEEKQLEEALVSINSQIEETESDIVAAEEDLATQYEQMCERIVYTYENGHKNYLEMIFSAKDFATMLNNVDYVLQITEYDRMKLKEYSDSIDRINDMKSQLQTRKEDADKKSEEISEKQEALELLSQKKEEELQGISEELVDAKELERQYQLEVQAQNEALAQIQAAIEAEKRAQEEAARQEAQKQQEQNGGETVESTPQPPQPEPSGNTYGFTWPCPASRRITSDYGLRESPTQGASTNHKGIDIGAPSGSNIVAAQAGKVITATYSNVSGNYVIINHGADSKGNIICTVYMHASSLNVSVGQEVSKGQVIAFVGSTGVSTGPHLHFGVTVNGSYTSPWNYL